MTIGEHCTRKKTASSDAVLQKSNMFIAIFGLAIQKNGIRRCRFYDDGTASVVLDRLPDHGIHPLTQVLAGLEVRHPFFRHHHLVTRLGIASYARWTAI